MCDGWGVGAYGSGPGQASGGAQCAARSCFDAAGGHADTYPALYVTCSRVVHPATPSTIIYYIYHACVARGTHSKPGSNAWLLGAMCMLVDDAFAPPAFHPTLLLPHAAPPCLLLVRAQSSLVDRLQRALQQGWLPEDTRGLASDVLQDARGLQHAVAAAVA